MASDRCKSCGAAITWVVTNGGKRMPLNPERRTVVTDAGAVVTGRESHFATCPQADAWRRHGYRG